jgi:hypothetical protein
MPFVQGQLRREPVSVAFRTECAHCSRSLCIEIDSALRYRLEDAQADPLIFLPLVDFAKVKDPSIVDVF